MRCVHTCGMALTHLRGRRMHIEAGQMPEIAVPPSAARFSPTVAAARRMSASASELCRLRRICTHAPPPSYRRRPSTSANQTSRTQQAAAHAAASSSSSIHLLATVPALALIRAESETNVPPVRQCLIRFHPDLDLHIARSTGVVQVQSPTAGDDRHRRERYIGLASDPAKYSPHPLYMYYLRSIELKQSLPSARK